MDQDLYSQGEVK